MRLRNVKGSREAIADSEFTINDFKEYAGKWNELFENNNPIRIEIGMGKGKFITELAKNNPDVNYIGIEKYSSVLIRAIEKRRELDIDNLLFIRMDAVEIEEAFGVGEVDRIYLNFSDPWPKDRHAKRRLTSRQFFERYDKILKKDGIVEFKTDNRPLFEFSLEEIPETNFKIDNHTFDLHGDKDAKIFEGNVMTEYEEKFVSIGNKICKLIASRRI
jgi:tRNA (guanine-N7-)-methyltransferase